MKRFIGLLLTLTGAAATLWGGFHVMSGQSSVQIPITDSFGITALVVGLAGVALLSIGLVWMRD
jgi:hypothetical protein